MHQSIEYHNIYQINCLNPTQDSLQYVHTAASQ